MKFYFTYENINSVEIIRVFTQFGKQLAWIDLANNHLYNTSASFKLFCEIAHTVRFMITGLQYLPKTTI